MSKKKSNKTKVIIIAAALICVAVFVIIFAKDIFGDNISPVPSTGFNTDADFVKVMDVGQADSILIYSNGYSALIDAGLAATAGDICEDLNSAEIKNIDAFLISHLHTDHTGGLEQIANAFKISNFIIPEADRKAECWSVVNAVKDKVLQKGGKVYTAVQGMNFDIGEFDVTVLAYFDEISGENNKSVIVMAEIDGLKFLFTGDAETKAENLLLKEGLNLDCDVLKVGHHGSRSSTSAKFLKATTPKFAAISVGADNVYSHPNDEILYALKEKSVKTFRTDTVGDITFFAENGKIRAETER